MTTDNPPPVPGQPSPPQPCAAEPEREPTTIEGWKKLYAARMVEIKNLEHSIKERDKIIAEYLRERKR